MGIKNIPCTVIILILGIWINDNKIIVNKLEIKKNNNKSLYFKLISFILMEYDLNKIILIVRTIIIIKKYKIVNFLLFPSWILYAFLKLDMKIFAKLTNSGLIISIEKFFKSLSISF